MIMRGDWCCRMKGRVELREVWTHFKRKHILRGQDPAGIMAWVFALKWFSLEVWLDWFPITSLNSMLFHCNKTWVERTLKIKQVLLSAVAVYFPGRSTNTDGSLRNVFDPCVCCCLFSLSFFASSRASPCASGISVVSICGCGWYKA